MPIYSPQEIMFLPGEYTVATLPNATDFNKAYAWVSDLHDGQADRVISSGGYWRPVRPLASKAIAMTNAGWVYQPLLNSPVIRLQGALTLGSSLELSKTRAYPGQVVRIKRETTGLFNISVKTGIAGLTIGTQAANSWADFTFDGTDWFQSASGGLL